MKSILICLLLVLVLPSHQYGETDQRARGQRFTDSGLIIHENMINDTEKSASVIQDMMRATSSHIMPTVTPEMPTTLSVMPTVTPRSQKGRNGTLKRRKPTPKRRKKLAKRLKPATKRLNPTTNRRKPTATRRVVYNSGMVCKLPIDAGNCEDLARVSTPSIRYGYAWFRARCIQFIYSGCGGNTNRFTSYSQCLTTCIPPEVSFKDFITLAGYLTGRYH